MSTIVPADEIETLVGITRHATRHYARAVSTERTVYVLHSQRCRENTPDLRDCWFSLALDNGIERGVWEDHQDKAVRVTINEAHRLIPATPGMVLSRKRGAK